MTRKKQNYFSLNTTFRMQPARVFGRAVTMLRIGVLVLPLRVVQKSEQLDHPQVRANSSADVQAMTVHPRPMREAVVPSPV